MSDIYDYGFDKTLNIPSQNTGTPTVYDNINGAINTGVVASAGNLSVSSVSNSSFAKYISPGDDIQAAIDAVNKAGGGKVYFRTGTYTVTTPLIGRTGVDLIGENESTTIINFNNAGANLSFTGTSIYNIGTITSITSGVFVTGSGTTWLGNVTTNHQFFIGNTWYKIAAVTSNTTLILAEGYQGNATLPGAAYRAAINIRDVNINDLTFQNSTVTGLTMDDCRNFAFENIKFTSNNKGLVITNCSEVITNNGLLSVSNVSNGVEVTNGRLINFFSFATPGNGGSGMVLNNVITGLIEASASDSNTADGYNFTSCSDLVIQVDASGNGGQGIEAVSGNDNLVITNSIANGNVSDGIKFTASSNNCRVDGGDIKNNGGYGINIANSNCNTNTIVVPALSNNTSGSINDSGTGTVIVISRNSTDTVSNKRITKRTLALSAGSATPAINTDLYDVVHITAQSAAITSFTTNLTGTPVDGDTLRVSITDDGTARVIAWGASFEGSPLPTTTVAATRLDVGFFRNTETTKWRCIGSE